MNLGSNILKLRKEKKMSQEQLAEKIGVTRQTISNWELNETTPDTNQLILLSKTFNVDIDRIIGNNINNLLIEKVNNTENLTKINIKMMKRIGIIFYFIILIFLVSLTIYFLNKRDFTHEYQMEFNCKNNEGESFNITVEFESEDNYYYLVATKIDKNNPMQETEKYRAGNSLYEVIKSLNAAKKIVIASGGKCK